MLKKNTNYYLLIIIAFDIFFIVENQETFQNWDNENSNNAIIDIFHHLINIFNPFLTFLRILYFIILFIIDVLLIPYHLIMFFYYLGIFSFFTTNIVLLGSYIWKNLIPQGFFWGYTLLITFIETIFYLITKLISGIWILIYSASNVLFYILYGIDYIYVNFTGKSSTLFYINDNNSYLERNSYFFFFNLFNPIFLWNHFGYLSIIIIGIELNLMSKASIHVKKFIFYICYEIGPIFMSNISNTNRFQIENNINDIFNSNNFLDQKVNQEACTICFEDYTNQVFYKILNYEDIKEKIENLLRTNILNFKSILSKKFDNQNKLIKLSCLHFYHGKCISDYIHFNKMAGNVYSCPTCRTRF